MLRDQSVIPIGKYSTVADAVFSHLREKYGADEHNTSKIQAALAELSLAFPEPSEVQGKKIIDIGSGHSIGTSVDTARLKGTSYFSKNINFRYTCA